MANTGTIRRSHKAEPDAAFELWLGRALRALYADATAEPIPPELLALIERSREGAAAQGGIEGVRSPPVKRPDDR